MQQPPVIDPIFLTTIPPPNIWKEICFEHSMKRPPFPEDLRKTQNKHIVSYDPSKHSPVFYGYLYVNQNVWSNEGCNDVDPLASFDPRLSHPALVGSCVVKPPPDRLAKSFDPTDLGKIKPPATATTFVDEQERELSGLEYLQTFVFPTLMPALEKLLSEAKKEHCFTRKRTRFQPVDFLVEYLYQNNPSPVKSPDININVTEIEKLKSLRRNIPLLDIPFVKEWIVDHPRKPLPWSLIWTEAEGAQIIQKYWKGYLVRRQPEVMELRDWQKQWRLDNRNIRQTVDEFWRERTLSSPVRNTGKKKNKLKAKSEVSLMAKKLDNEKRPTSVSSVELLNKN